MKRLIFISTLFLLMGCGKNAQPINYGSDGCDFCRMTIVDKAHVAQLVTSKGKNFKFDAIECMVHYLNQQENDQNYHLLLVADLSNPGETIDAKSAVYIISKKIPSPMGAFLSALKTESEAEEIIAENGGEIYNWNEILNKLNHK
ncbi:nitrous oxide reductase accessory protein NosL [Myroides indicus]|uniref:Copper chaperone NosL n=1 Tax=Myroides indicus TaxID=1323422 RepID=A0A4R7EXS8_9FLAO|nr:nitrous oxide reductase accessory protein NosL [Myroides indicus]TDS57200.1 copper chaperone NosL [Myroides indicus]